MGSSKAAGMYVGNVHIKKVAIGRNNMKPSNLSVEKGS